MWRCPNIETREVTSWVSGNYLQSCYVSLCLIIIYIYVSSLKSVRKLWARRISWENFLWRAPHKRKRRFFLRFTPVFTVTPDHRYRASCSSIFLLFYQNQITVSCALINLTCLLFLQCLGYIYNSQGGSNYIPFVTYSTFLHCYVCLFPWLYFSRVTTDL